MDYTLEPTDKQKQLIKKYWTKLVYEDQKFIRACNNLQEKMRKETGIEDIEFFFVKGKIQGVGNESGTMKLIRNEELI